MLQTLPGRKKYEKAMSDEHPLYKEKVKTLTRFLFFKNYTGNEVESENR